MLFSALGTLLIHPRKELLFDFADDPLDLDLVELPLVRIRPDVRRVRDQDPTGDEAVRLSLPHDILENFLEHVVVVKTTPVGLADR